MKTANRLIEQLEKWVDIKNHKPIIDVYNTLTPLPRGYKVSYKDQWCATGLSAAIILTDMEDIIGTECSCGQFIEIFKRKGIWIEDGTITPKRGDIILYNWEDGVQPNDGWAEHIGIVTKVANNKITVLECNYRNSVGYRTIQLGWGYIRGYGRPNYEVDSPTNEELADQVIQGLWGNGLARKLALTEAGYNYSAIQKIVNQKLSR